MDANVEEEDEEGGAHEVVEAEVLAKRQVENTAGHRHELPTAMANIGTTAFNCECSARDDVQKESGMRYLQHVRTGS
jgi:hypothetical protein